MALMGKGFYLLLLHLLHQREIQVGRLGRFHFLPGYYIYCGSALGGLRGRIARHRRPAKKGRWHIDYLLEHARLSAVWGAASTERLECLCCQAISQLSGAELPVPGFGSSDCHCPAHLLRFPQKPSLEAIQQALALYRPGLRLHEL